MLPRKSTTDSWTRVFQYRLLNNVLLLQLSALQNETCGITSLFPSQRFYFSSECPSTQTLWNRLQHWLYPNIKLPPLNPQNAVLGFFEVPSSSDLTVANHILLIFKQALSNKQNCLIIPNIDCIKQKIRQAYQIEKKIATENGTLSKHLKDMGPNSREIIKIGWGRNWNTSYTNCSCVCL